jgi:hypothetical protein
LIATALAGNGKLQLQSTGATTPAVLEFDGTNLVSNLGLAVYQTDGTTKDAVLTSADIQSIVDAAVTAAGELSS